MKRNTDQNPKFRRLGRKLGLRGYSVTGILEMMWHFTTRVASDGGIGKWSNEDIADAVDWERDADELVRALVETKWLDEDPNCRLYVHDWHDHCDDAVHMAMARRTGLFANGRAPSFKRFKVIEQEKFEAQYRDRYGDDVFRHDDDESEDESTVCAHTNEVCAHDAQAEHNASALPSQAPPSQAPPSPAPPSPPLPSPAMPSPAQNAHVGASAPPRGRGSKRAHSRSGVSPSAGSGAPTAGNLALQPEPPPNPVLKLVFGAKNPNVRPHRSGMIGGQSPGRDDGARELALKRLKGRETDRERECAAAAGVGLTEWRESEAESAGLTVQGWLEARTRRLEAELDAEAGR